MDSGKRLEDYIASVEKGANNKGKSNLLKHLNGERLTQRQAIIAYCYDCTGFYDEGKKDCGNKTCPLYPFMPFKGKGVEI